MAADLHDSDAESADTESLSMVELLRWGWEQLTARPELTAPFVLAAVLLTLAQAGITTIQTEIGMVPRFAIWVWPVYLVAFVVGWAGLGAVFLAGADILADVERRHTQRVRLAAKRLPSVFVAAILGGIPVVAGYLVLVVPGIYFTIKLAFTFPACVIDEASAISGLRRSFVTTDGHTRLIFSLVLTFTALMVFVSAAITLRFSHGGTGFVGPLLQNLITAVLMPLFGLAFTRLYVRHR